MYRTTRSIAAQQAGRTRLDPGQNRPWHGVLCAPLAVGICTAAISAICQSAAKQANNDANQTSDPGANTSCPDSSLNFTAAVTYIPLGRLTNRHIDVAPGASVDELVAATRA